MQIQHINKILECFGQAGNSDDELIKDLQEIIAKDCSQKNNVLATVESDFSNGNLEFWDVISFEAINQQLSTFGNGESETIIPTSGVAHMEYDLSMDAFFEVTKGAVKDE